MREWLGNAAAGWGERAREIKASGLEVRARWSSAMSNQSYGPLIRAETRRQEHVRRIYNISTALTEQLEQYILIHTGFSWLYLSSSSQSYIDSDDSLGKPSRLWKKADSAPPSGKKSASIEAESEALGRYPSQVRGSLLARGSRCFNRIAWVDSVSNKTSRSQEQARHTNSSLGLNGSHCY